MYFLHKNQNLCNLPIDKCMPMCYNWRPGDERTGPNFYYTMPPVNLSRVFAKIKKEIIFPEMLDILLPMWYYNSVKRGCTPRADTETNGVNGRTVPMPLEGNPKNF